jgi:hypothetical protein
LIDEIGGAVHAQSQRKDQALRTVDNHILREGAAILIGCGHRCSRLSGGHGGLV